MRTVTLLFAALFLAAPLSAQDGASAAPDAVSEAQALYADARYEEALRAFDALKEDGGQDSRTALAIEQGRAFCLLALGRDADAHQAIEAMLRLDPSFRLAEDDTPPKIHAVFREVRRQTLTGVLQQRYTRAKQAYERKAYDEAVAGFGQVLALLDDPDLVLDEGPRADMRLVAKAFGDLAKAASAPPPAPSPPSPPPASGSTASDAAGEPVAADSLHDAASKGVTAPVPERTDVRIPESLRRTGPTGDVVVEVVVSAAGTVESATVRQSPDAVFGALVARAAMDWRYRPASKAGVPVRYRLMARVVVSR
jgi:TonB family protein